jgi:hypothetical protein
MGGYHGHVEAVGFAGLKIQELEDVLLGHRANLFREARSLVEIAVGDQPTNRDAIRAIEMTKILGDKLDQAMQACEEVKLALNEYSAGWM